MVRDGAHYRQSWKIKKLSDLSIYRGTMVDQKIKSSWRPWAAWILGSLFFFYGFVLRVAPSVMVADLMRDFAVGATVLGNLSAFYFYAYASLQIPVGLMLDRFGPRRLLPIAALVCTLGASIFAIAQNLPIAYLGRLLIGIGAGFSWVGALTLITLYFPPQRFALLVGIAQLFGMLGAVFGQAPLAAAVNAFGWRETQLFTAFFGIIIALLLFMIVQNQKQLVTDSTDRTSSLKIGLKQVIRNWQTWACAIVGGATTSAPLAFGGLWGVPYLTQAYGIDRPTAAFFASLIFLGFGIGAAILGLISDAWRRRKPLMIGGSFILLVTLCAMLYLPDHSLIEFGILNFICGLGAGCMVIAIAAAREHNPAHAAGATYGLVNTFVVGSGAIFQPLIGALLDAQWDGRLNSGARIYSAEAYTLALTCLPIAAAVGFAAALTIRETHCRQQA